MGFYESAVDLGCGRRRSIPIRGARSEGVHETEDPSLAGSRRPTDAGRPIESCRWEGASVRVFRELRKFIEPARSDLFFVDPYLDADFVSRYLPHVPVGVTIRLLGHKRIATLLPAVEMFVRQSGRAVQVRWSAGLHDRFLFVDRKACYLSVLLLRTARKTLPPR